MKEKIKLAWLRLKYKIRRKTILQRNKKVFHVGGQTLIITDIIDLLFFWRSSRLLSVAGTGIFYSNIPLFPCYQRLMCYNYCVAALQNNKKDFYKKVMVLGCGGGAMPLWLLKRYPQATVDVVELFPEIIEISKAYFLKKWENSNRLFYHCIDARDYEAPAENYQFIFCDLFDGKDLAPVVTEQDFAKKLHSLLCVNGVLVINCGFFHLGKVRRVFQDFFSHIEIVKRDYHSTQVLVMIKE